MKKLTLIAQYIALCFFVSGCVSTSSDRHVEIDTQGRLYNGLYVKDHETLGGKGELTITSLLFLDQKEARIISAMYSAKRILMFSNRYSCLSDGEIDESELISNMTSKSLLQVYYNHYINLDPKGRINNCEEAKAAALEISGYLENHARKCEISKNAFAYCDDYYIHTKKVSLKKEDFKSKFEPFLNGFDDEIKGDVLELITARGSTFSYDDFEDAYRIGNRNNRNNLYVTLFVKDGKSNARMGVNYRSDDWIFVDRISVKTDDKIWKSKTFKANREVIKNQRTGGIREWEVFKIGKEERALLDRVVKSDVVKIRFHGSQYYHDHELDYTSKALIKSALRVSDHINNK